MPYRLINIDMTMFLLNATSVGTLAISWLTEHMTGLGGFIVMVSVAILNIAKAISVYSKRKK